MSRTGRGAPVREDYSHDGKPGSYLTYDKAPRRAYRWGEDGHSGDLRSRKLL